MNFQAQLWKRTEDHEGEMTLILKVPLSDAEQAKAVPTQTLLNVNIEITE